MLVIVEIYNKLRVVPEAWLENDKCYWPPCDDEYKLREYIRREKAVGSCWKYKPACRVLHCLLYRSDAYDEVELVLHALNSVSSMKKAHSDLKRKSISPTSINYQKGGSPPKHTKRDDERVEAEIGRHLKPMNERLTKVESILHNLVKNKGVDKTQDKQNVLSLLPLKSDEELKELENSLKSEDGRIELVDSFVSTINELNGQTIQRAVSAMLQKTMSNSLQAEYCFTGRGSRKKEFKHLQIYSCMRTAMKLCLGDTASAENDIAIQAAVSSCLRSASGRLARAYVQKKLNAEDF